VFSRNATLARLVGDLERLVDELPGLPAADLDADAGALVHLHVRLLRLLERPTHLLLYRLHQALQLVRHHQYIYIFLSTNYKARIYVKSLEAFGILGLRRDG
jgi:hypothetical protein